MNIKKFFTILIVVLILASTMFGTTVSAANENYSMYLMQNGDFYGAAIPLAYETVKTITYIDGLDSQLNSPTDLFLATDGNLYIVDSNNARVLKVSKEGKLLAEFSGSYGDLETEYVQEKKAEYKAEYDEKKLDERMYMHMDRVISSREIKKMKNPSGVYVDKDGDVYIADTDNNRILHLSPDGEYVEMFVEPEASTFDYVDYPFKPSKLCINEGRIYVINYMDFHGFITLDPENNFLGYVAQSKIPYDFSYEVLKTLFSKEVIDATIARETPPYFSNFVISNSLVYAVAKNDKKNQIKKLTPAGNNVFPEGIYGELDMDDKGDIVYASMVDIAVGKTGLVYAADSAEMAIYIYDSEGNNVAYFGGGSGEYKGSFGNISAIELSQEDDTLYVLDKAKNTIQIMKPTQFMNMVIDASSKYTEGKYEEALKPWEDVLKMHNTYTLAIKGIAKAKFGQKEYQEAMDLYKLAQNRPGYSQAFFEQRLINFRSSFGWVIGGIVVAIVALIYLLGYLRKVAAKVDLIYDYSDDKYGIKIFFHTWLLTIFHPIDALTKLKMNRHRFKWWSMALLLFLIFVVRVIYIYIVHFPMSTQIPQYTDFVQELVVLGLPLLAWIVISFAMTSISNGKTTMKETFVSTLFAFSPYIIFTIPLGLFSNIMCGNEAGLYNSIQTIILLWSISLVLLALMNLNEYSFKQMVGNTIKILFAAACVFMIFGMIYIIINQFIIFVEEINLELTYLANR